MAALRRLLRAWPFALVAWLYIATSPYHRGLNNPNEMVRVYMSVAAVDDNTFAIDGVIRRWGLVDDKAKRDGQLYSSKAPLQSLIGVPAYLVAKPVLKGMGQPVDARHVTFVLRLLGSVSVGILFAWALIAWARRRAEQLGAPAAQGTALGLAWALGTMHYPYALTFTGHILAAATAGGCYLGVAALTRAPVGSTQWRNLALGVGALGGFTPFAEYPAALVALPALIGAFIVTPGPARGRLFLYLALGGGVPFGLGLWSHDALWGSPFATGYGFLENPGYVEVHEKGFFGVTAPKPEALFGTLFSAGTGLFFFSPYLAVGLLPMLARVVRGRRGSAPPDGYGRSLAIIALVGLVLELLFISGHRGWRGGWTLGPRYIIPVVVLLGFWCVEALGHARLRGLLMALAALSIVLTGPAAALYPHLSDVYVHPLSSFLVPSYLRGEMSYGLAHALGFEGHVANLFHLIPLALAVFYVAGAGVPSGAASSRLLAVGVVTAAAGAVFLAIPESDDRKARRENRRLWRFWEPEGGPHADIRVGGRGKRPLATARARWGDVRVVRLGGDGATQDCLPKGSPCRYGPQPWQHFGPEVLNMDGARVPVLFMHPVAGDTVEATIPVPAKTRSATLRYGLADASVESDNPHPAVLELSQGAAILAIAQAGEDYGFQQLPVTLSSTKALTLRVTAEQDGARVLGWDVEFYDEP